MASTTASAAVSHVGKVRANNQDSGFAGSQLFIVADGMGGHAGGDVASAIAVNRIAEADTQQFSSPQEAEFALQSSLVAANQLLAETVFEHPELTGMGTTVSAFIRVGDSIAIAHIGDSRIYLAREGEFTQVTSDHTFVQRLVDSGRITPEEAAVHPRRSVLMRVLGDIDAAPEIDTSILGTAAGDRWLLCSDGLSSYVSEERIRDLVLAGRPVAETVDSLVAEALEHGAPDNVTVIIVDIDPAGGEQPSPVALTVGSAASPLEFDPESGKRLRLPSLLLHPIKSSSAVARETHLESDAEDYLDALIAEDRRRARRRRLTWLIAIGLVIIGAVAAGVVGYQWTQTRYYIGVNGQNVAIYQGVQQSIGPLPLSSVFQTTDVRVADLPEYFRNRVENTISADSITDALAIVTNLEQNADPGTSE